MTICGIDGGGSKTAFVLVEDRREHCRAASGPGNILTVGVERVRQSLKQGLEALGSEPDVVSGGFAGAGQPEQAAVYASLLQELCPRAKVCVTTDAIASYLGAIGPEPGILLIAGTGSIALARNDRGEFVRAGGWGYLFGDEGGGFWIGKEAIRECLAEPEPGRSEFGRTLAAALSLNSLVEVAGAWSVGTIGIPEVAGLAPLVIGAYPNEPAGSILRRAATELRFLVERLRPAVGADAPIVGSGSIATNATIKELIALPFVAAKRTPEWGAVLFAEGSVA